MNSMLKGETIFLRAPEKKDATRMLLWENNPDNWKVSQTEVPFSMDLILEYVSSAQQVRTHGQVRFMICLNEGETPVGTIDLYDVNFKHGFAGVGILIAEAQHRERGFAREALHLLINYSRDFLALTNLFCSIYEDNLPSRSLFESTGFELTGTRKNWFLYKGKRYNEYLYQLCLNE